MKRISLLFMCAAIMVFLTACSNGVQTYKYSIDMSEDIAGKHWNLYSAQGSFEKQLSVYGNKIKLVDSEGNDTYLTIKEWDYKNGKLITDDSREFVVLKSGNIKEEKLEYKKTEDVVDSVGDKIYEQALDLYRKNSGISFYGRHDDLENKNYSIASEIIEILETLPDDYNRYGEQSKQQAISLIKNVIDSQFPGVWEYTEWDDYGSYIFRCKIHSSLSKKKIRYGNYECFDGELWLIKDCYTMDGEYFWTPESGTSIPFGGNSKYSMKDGNLVVVDGGYAWTAHRYNE